MVSRGQGVQAVLLLKVGLPHLPSCASGTLAAGDLWGNSSGKSLRGLSGEVEKGRDSVLGDQNPDLSPQQRV